MLLDLEPNALVYAVIYLRDKLLKRFRRLMEGRFGPGCALGM